MKLIKKFLHFVWGVPVIAMMFILSGIVLSLDPEINQYGGYEIFRNSLLPEIVSGVLALAGLLMLIKGLLEEANAYFSKDDEGDGTY